MTTHRSRRQSAPPDPGRIENLRLSDGRHLQLRAIAAADAASIAAAFTLLNEEEVRRRFLHPLKELGAEHLFRLTHPVPGRDFVVVAAEPLPPGDALVGAVARLSCDDNDSHRAEFGLLVSHYITGLGLGRLLMERLFEWCRRHHVAELWGDVMDDNTAMLKLAESLGFHREMMRGSPGLVRIKKTFP